MTAQTPVHDTLADLIAAAAGDSWVPPGPAAAGERVRSLEVRWIFPGRLTGVVAGWFGRFPARTESREDAYLLDPQLARGIAEGPRRRPGRGEGVPRQPGNP